MRTYSVQILRVNVVVIYKASIAICVETLGKEKSIKGRIRVRSLVIL